MMPTLVIIAPLWNSELEELIQITKNSFQIKILTQKQNFDFADPYIEILQCFDTYSPLEMTKLLPWLIQLSAAQFHLIMPPSPSPRQLAGVGTIISIVKALPQSYLTHSPWPGKSWTLSLWLKAFQSLFDGSLLDYGMRRLSLPKTTRIKNYDEMSFSSTSTSSSSSSHTTSEKPEARTPMENDWVTDQVSDGVSENWTTFGIRENINIDETSFQNGTKDLNLYSCLWVFPTQNLLEKEWQDLTYALLRQKENRIELWNWEELPVREQNKMRQQFYLAWNQFQPRPPRWNFEDWTSVQFLVLTGNHTIAISEKDLLDLVLIHQIHIIMDESMRRQLHGPWKQNDTFWLWDPKQSNQDSQPWNNSHLRLPLKSLSELVAFRDQLSNEVLRSLSR